MAFPAAACSGRARLRGSTSRAASSAGHVQVDRDDAVDAQVRPLDDGNELLIVQAALDGHLAFLHVHRHVGGCQTRHPDQDVAGHLLRQGVVQLLDRDILTGRAVRRLGGIGAPSDLADQIRLRHDVDWATDVVHHWDGGDVVVGQGLGDRLERGVSSTADNGPGHEISYRSVLPLTWQLRTDDEGRSAGPPGPSAVWWARRPRARLE